MTPRSAINFSPRRRLPLAAGALLLLLLIAPAAARADTTVSENWSGYAVHRTGTSFKKVTASWQQPSGTCAQGEPTYSAFWVGLGGYDLNSDALEQIGTEFDCTASGAESVSAWYELVPAPTRSIKLKVDPGDTLTASVTVVGSKVTLDLADKTRHKSFSKTITDHTIDVSSAEWIAEAPSECFNGDECRTLPLADFGSVRFSNASAETAKQKTGSISSHLWSTTEIVLGASGTRFASYGSPAAAATPSSLGAAGKAFTVDYDNGSTEPQDPADPDGGSVSGHQRVVERVGLRPG